MSWKQFNRIIRALTGIVVSLLIVTVLVLGVAYACGLIGKEAGEDTSVSSLPSSAAAAPSAGTGADSEASPLLSVEVMDVGQGLSVLITCGKESLLYDGGDYGSESVIDKRMRELGIGKRSDFGIFSGSKSITYMVASHYDSDHVAGFIHLLKEDFAYPDHFIGPDYIADTPTYRNLMEQLQKAELSVVSPGYLDYFYLGPAKVTVLSDKTKNYEDENDQSIALLVSYGEFNLFLGGDLGLIPEREIAERYDLPQGLIYVADHHGSGFSSDEEFFVKMQPSAVIFSCGRDNDYGHPAPRVLKMCETYNSKVYRTDQQGAIRVRTNGSLIQFEKE